MTAGLITGLNPMQDLTNIAPTPNASDNSTSFSDALKASTDNRVDTQSEQTKNSKKDENVGETEESKEAVKDTKSDDNKTEDKRTEDKKTADKADEENVTDNIDEEVEEAVTEVVGQAMQMIAKVLDVPVEKVEEALDTIQLEATDLLDTSNVADVVVEITDAQSVMDIMTDEDLYAEVKEITDNINEVVEELAQELEVEPKEIVTIAKDIEPKEVTSDVEITEADVETVKAADTTENKTVQNDKNASMDNDSEQQQNDTGFAGDFNRSIIDNLKDAFNETNATTSTGYTADDIEHIINQVQENLRVNLKEDITEMEMNLHPASLGNVKVQIAAKDGVITANFVTQNETVKAAIESQIVELKENMNEQGVKVEAIEVTVASHAFDENLSKEGEHTAASEEEGKKKKIRSINLNDDALGEDEEIDDEIRIAKEMMERNGNTVDYLA